jgi:transposase
MSQKSAAPSPKPPAEQVVRDIRRATRKLYSAEEKIRIVSVVECFGTVRGLT